MSRRGAEWYKREPRAFLEGVRHLTEREIAVYAIVLDLIYDGAGETYDDPKHIASYFSDLGSAAVRNAIDRLVTAGKLIRHDGLLTNKRARNEGKTRKELGKTSENPTQFSEVSAEFLDSNFNESNHLNEKNTHQIREDKTREEKDEKDDAADAASPSSRYAFQAKTIKLNENHLEQWRKAYPSLRLEAELLALDEWAATKGKGWFSAVSSALRNKQVAADERAAERQERMRLEANKPPTRQHIDGRI